MAEGEFNAAVGACLPLSYFGGHVPRPFLRRECAECHQAIVVSSATAAVPNITLCCDRCVRLLQKVEELKGNAPIPYRRLSGSTDPDSAFATAVAAGELAEDPDSRFGELPELTEAELAGLQNTKEEN